MEIVKKLQDRGFKCYLVGGSVRDLLMGKCPDEWDLTTDARPEEVAQSFQKVVPTGLEFGTQLIILEDGKYEVTTFRTEGRYLDGRHPSIVNFSKELHEDLSRRDFTVNAMAFDPVKGELVDEYNGQKDLKKKIIRTVGDPLARFFEDGLRTVRACRFAAQLNFKIEKKTLSAVKQSLNVVQKVARERIHDEIIKVLTKADYPSICFDYMLKTGLLNLFIPELVLAVGVKQPREFHKYDVFYHSLYACDAAPKDRPAVRLAALLHDISKPECKDGDHFYGHDQKGGEIAYAILKRLKFGNELTNKVINLIKNHMFNYESSWTDAAVRRFINRVGMENLLDLFALRIADTSAMEREIDSGYLLELKKRIDKIVADENALKVSDLAVNGQDVMQILQIGPSPKVGETLNSLLEKVIDDPALNQREILLKLIK